MKSRHKEGVGGYCFLYLYKRRFLWGGDGCWELPRALFVTSLIVCYSFKRH